MLHRIVASPAPMEKPLASVTMHATSTVASTPSKIIGRPRQTYPWNSVLTARIAFLDACVRPYGSSLHEQTKPQNTQHFKKLT